MPTTPGQIQLRRGAASAWTSNNPTLAAGEVGIETDTGFMKIGDGAGAWTTLKYTGVGKLANAGATGQVLQKTPTGAQWGSLALPAVTVDFPENHGAKKDGRVVIDAATTNGSPTLSSATAAFTAGDVGKHVGIYQGTDVGGY